VVGSGSRQSRGETPNSEPGAGEQRLPAERPVRGLAGVWFWGGLERKRGRRRKGTGFGWQEFGGGEVSTLEGEGRRARGQRAAGGTGGCALEVWDSAVRVSSRRVEPEGLPRIVLR
jgi:hypothetical protein